MMKVNELINGQFETDLKEWLNRYFECEVHLVVSGNNAEWDEYVDFSEWDNFIQLSNSAQFGIVQDFADSTGLYVNNMNCDSFDIKNGWSTDHFLVNPDTESSARDDSRIRATEKLNEIYNKRFSNIKDFQNESE